MPLEKVQPTSYELCSVLIVVVQRRSPEVLASGDRILAESTWRAKDTFPLERSSSASSGMIGCGYFPLSRA